ncbi:hypothetical protein C823_006658 [Eubacterium plexicaudatum ASF492]|nr:hypothetical protein C823_006658 [Eubacterium plexicaudatum ASF492]
MKLGEYQVLQVVKQVEFGIYLAEHANDQTRVLLPKKQVPPDIRIGDELEIFYIRIQKTV